MQKVYIAFSINGTNCFITANKTLLENEKLSPDFNKIPSRRRDYKSADGIKLQYKKLLTKAGKPLRSPIAVLKVFNDLKKDGWDIDSKRFIAKHWKRHTH